MRVRAPSASFAAGLPLKSHRLRRAWQYAFYFFSLLTGKFLRRLRGAKPAGDFLHPAAGKRDLSLPVPSETCEYLRLW
ncbi:MAG TPA: hypothetical protein P5324_03355, partial [Anaerohalosphaeraceae bacterium]|nr:hypothetical protein [Anaerohalosphaeraceae bacterium]HRV19595.1 hypothetical protein [Anaerohalosphaeraceae bacterium]